MKVVHLVPKFLPSIGGVENFVFDLVQVQMNSIDVEIFTTDFYNFETKERLNIIKDFPYVKRFSAHNCMPLLPRGLGYFSFNMLSEVLRREDIDLIHSHSFGYFTTYIGAVCKALKGVRHIIQTHSDPGRKSVKRRLMNVIAREIYRYADRIIAISEVEKDYLIRSGIARKNLSYIPIGLNLERFKIQTPDLGIDYILFVGRFDIDQKGIDILLKAFVEVIKKHKEVRLVIIGEGSRQYIQDMLDRLKLRDNVILKVGIPRYELIRYYQHCRFLVLPSRFEPFGMVILEAFACGKPVIATQVGGIPSVVNEKNGMLVKADSVKELALAMNKMLELNPLEYQSLSVNALRTVKRFDIRIIADQIFELYKEVLELPQ
ncbi:MAG TPA: glycosyltransferase family 4 protein [Geobacterales bacterium]|nr:glycosyltransferase family 4 protein [Geobacterales bacterium]